MSMNQNLGAKPKKSAFKPKVTSSYRNMNSSDSDSDLDSRCSCSTGSSRSKSRTPRRMTGNQQSGSGSGSPKKAPRRFSNKFNNYKFSVARSKHMKRIRYALSPISGRKLYPLEPSKTNQPTYASSGQIGCRMTSRGIKYTFLLEKVLQGQLNSIKPLSVPNSNANQLSTNISTFQTGTSPSAVVHPNAVFSLSNHNGFSSQNIEAHCLNQMLPNQVFGLAHPNMHQSFYHQNVNGFQLSQPHVDNNISSHVMNNVPLAFMLPGQGNQLLAPVMGHVPTSMPMCYAACCSNARPNTQIANMAPQVMENPSESIRDSREENSNRNCRRSQKADSFSDLTKSTEE